RSARWQILRHGKQEVKGVLATGRMVDQIAAFKSSGRIGIPVQAHDGSLVIQGLLRAAARPRYAPVLEEAQEVVDPAVRTEKGVRSTGGIVKSNRLARGNCGSVIGGGSEPVTTGSGSRCVERVNQAAGRVIERTDALRRRDRADSAIHGAACILPVVR